MTDVDARIAPGGRTAGGIAFDDEGSGPPLALVHAGVADRRMWAPVVATLGGSHRIIRHDIRGVGESLPPTGPWSHHTDFLALLDELLITQAHVVGASLGAGIAVEAALARPGSVASLVLVAPGGALLGDAPPSFRPIWAAEVEALDRGDLDGAVEINLRAWVDGPLRPPGAVDPAYDYPHTVGQTVIGGYVYRGNAYPLLRGQYVYGDFCSGRIWTISAGASSLVRPTLRLDTSLAISSFGLNGGGELFVLSLDGGIYRVGATP